MSEIVVNRHNELVDPVMHIWGYEIAWYLYLGGLVAGLMVFSTLVRSPEGGRASRWVRWAPFAAPVLLSVGMVLLFLDLELKHHVYRFYLAFKPTSPMSWGSWILLLIYPATILLGLANLTDGQAERLAGWSPFRRVGLGRVINWLRSFAVAHGDTVRKANVLLGLALGLYTGILLGTLQARALWNSTLLAPLFLASGLSTGAAFMMLFPLEHKEHSLLRRWDLAIIGVEIVLLLLFFLDRANGGAVGLEQVSRFFGGDLTAVFWSLVVVLGLAVPATLEVLETRKRLKPSLAAPILILVGGLVLRWILVHAGQVTPVA